MKEEILKYLKNKLCVIATSSTDGIPECAVIDYTVEPPRIEEINI